MLHTKHKESNQYFVIFFAISEIRIRLDKHLFNLNKKMVSNKEIYDNLKQDQKKAQTTLDSFLSLKT